MNAKLKRYQSWEVVPIDEFVDNISDIYKMQEEKIALLFVKIVDFISILEVTFRIRPFH